ncbi:MAG: sugar ABC transporter permease, partial [Lachnospiraceae bacterium]|nr:sugar ABC transporter permease [Lachnospiraceae bacterium]
MFGIAMAFEKYQINKGIFGSQLVGLANFKRFFTSPFFWRLLRNTLLISFYGLLFSFPLPIIFALCLNEVRNRGFKKTVQTISYLPYF